MSLKLCYIWVEEYRNFENLGVNFSSSEKFNYNHRTGLISHDAINTLPNNFFENDRVIDVTGIIGKNGTGKSNLLELACSLLKGGTTAINTNFLIIIKKDGRYECHTSPDLTHIRRWDLPIDMMLYKRAIEPLKVVYFSNVYDEREHYFDARVSNLSGNYRYKKSRSSSKKTSDFVKQLQFVRSSFMDKSEIPYPDKIAISLKRLNITQRTRNLTFVTFEDSNEYEKYLNEFYKDINRLKPSIDKLYYNLLFSFILEFSNIIREDVKDSSILSEAIFSSTKQLFERIDEVKLTSKSKLTIAEYWENWLRSSSDYLLQWASENTPLRKKLAIEAKELNDELILLEKFHEFIDSSNLKIEVEGSRNRKEEKYVIAFRRV